jgi:DNA-3-methyladenine glycosylase II
MGRGGGCQIAADRAKGKRDGMRRSATASKRPAKAGRPPLYDDAGWRIDGEESLARALARLRAADPALMDHLLGVAGPPPLRLREPGFAGLASIIVGQQLSTASAGAIFRRLETALAPLSPATMLAATDETLRAVGLSVGKVRTLRATAEAVLSGALPIDALHELTAEAAHAAMVSVPGIGPWTADLFLLFCLGHPDAWPAGDLALQEALRVALGRAERPGAGELVALAEGWRPYRAVAARLLWAYYRAVKGRSGVILAAT